MNQNLARHVARLSIGLRYIQTVEDVQSVFYELIHH